MAYTAHKWNSGDTITAERLNALENGVKNEQVGPAGKAGADGKTGTKGADGKSVKAIALTVDGDGKVTAGQATLSDNSKLDITVTNA